MPTKIAEFLATGRPIVVNKGLGDFDEYLTEFNAGVILNGSENNLRSMAHNLTEILADTETPMRCRALAEKYFDVDKGAQKYLDLYPKILLKT
jgi:glycosyltransferase involved in cell wall biosynthesis